MLAIKGKTFLLAHSNQMLLSQFDLMIAAKL